MHKPRSACLTAGTFNAAMETADGIRQIQVAGEDLSNQGHIFAIIGEASKASVALEVLPSRSSVHKHSLLNVSIFGLDNFCR